MTDTTMRHPRVLTALTIVRDRSEFSHRSAIRSVALFHVVQDRERGARFSLDHHVFDRETSRADIIAGIAERIPQDATVIARAPRILRHALRYMAATGTVPPPADLQLLQKLRDDLEILPLECRSAALDETGAAFALRRAGPGSSTLAKARRAPEGSYWSGLSLWIAPAEPRKEGRWIEGPYGNAVNEDDAELYLLSLRYRHREVLKVLGPFRSQWQQIQWELLRPLWRNALEQLDQVGGDTTKLVGQHLGLPQGLQHAVIANIKNMSHLRIFRRDKLCMGKRLSLS